MVMTSQPEPLRQDCSVEVASGLSIELEETRVVGLASREKGVILDQICPTT